MKIQIVTPYSTITAELTSHQVRDILHTTLGYAANNEDEAQREKEADA